MAKRPLYDFLPRNSEIHNFSDVKLTERQSRVLGMGFKFRPTLSPPPEARRVRLQDMFSGEPQDPDFNPRLYVPTGWNPPRQNPDLEDKLFYLRQELQQSFADNKPHWRNNLTSQERTELKELKNNPDVRILATDKNLGPALMSTNWIRNYSHICKMNSHIVKSPQGTGMLVVLMLFKCREQFMTTYSRFISPNVAKFLRSYDHFVSPAKFYVIPKIHLWREGQAASHSYITRPSSIFVDELIKPKILMPTVLRDSSELIQLLEQTALPASNCFLVTADVVSLYPNVDTKKALVALDLLLRRARPPETPLLIQLARLVFENKFVL